MLPAGGSLTELASQYLAADINPFLHVAAHTSASLQSWRRKGLSPLSPLRKDAHLCAAKFDRRNDTPAPLS
jgi:hypothetical protein